MIDNSAQAKQGGALSVSVFERLASSSSSSRSKSRKDISAPANTGATPSSRAAQRDVTTPGNRATSASASASVNRTATSTVQQPTMTPATAITPSLHTQQRVEDRRTSWTEANRRSSSTVTQTHSGRSSISLPAGNNSASSNSNSHSSLHANNTASNVSLGRSTTPPASSSTTKPTTPPAPAPAPAAPIPIAAAVTTTVKTAKNTTVLKMDSTAAQPVKVLKSNTASSSILQTTRSLASSANASSRQPQQPRSALSSKSMSSAAGKNTPVTRITAQPSSAHSINRPYTQPSAALIRQPGSTSTAVSVAAPLPSKSTAASGHGVTSMRVSSAPSERRRITFAPGTVDPSEKRPPAPAVSAPSVKTPSSMTLNYNDDDDDNGFSGEGYDDIIDSEAADLVRRLKEAESKISQQSQRIEDLEHQLFESRRKERVEADEKSAAVKELESLKKFIATDYKTVDQLKVQLQEEHRTNASLIIFNRSLKTQLAEMETVLESLAAAKGQPSAQLAQAALARLEQERETSTTKK